MEEASDAAATISARISKWEDDDDDDDDDDDAAAVTNHSLVCNMLEKPTNQYWLLNQNHKKHTIQ